MSPLLIQHIFDTVATIRRGLFRGIPSDSWAGDDAELAIQAIRAGKRAIKSPEIGFLEELPDQKLRKIKSRRAAGHIRLMFQNLDMISLKKQSKLFESHISKNLIDDGFLPDRIFCLPWNVDIHFNPISRLNGGLFLARSHGICSASFFED